jgi:hypothetical protein
MLAIATWTPARVILEMSMETCSASLARITNVSATHLRLAAIDLFYWCLISGWLFSVVLTGERVCCFLWGYG